MKWLVALFVLIATSRAAYERPEEDGYYRREHSLVQPYHGKCLEIPFYFVFLMESV